MVTKSYSELIQIPTYEDRVEYLRTHNKLGRPTFGYERWLNQGFYRSKEWRTARREAIIRDSGCDLALLDRPIHDRILVHHINPIVVDDIVDAAIALLDLENLVCVSHETHNQIHYSEGGNPIPHTLERLPNDTIPWR